jgi:hypothetical protein
MSQDEVTGGSAGPPPNEPDAHGQAALLLAESTLHALIEASVLTVDEAIGVVTTAAEVKVEVATQAGESRTRMQESLNLLNRIRQSLSSGAV